MWEETYIDSVVIEPVVEFLSTLGVLADGDSLINYMTEDGETKKDAFNAATIREDIRKITDFHTEAYSKLKTDRTLDEVIDYGIENRKIELLSGIDGITAERCYQVIQKRGTDLTDEEILQTSKNVGDFYFTLYGDNEAVELTRKTYEPLRREIGELAEALTLSKE